MDTKAPAEALPPGILAQAADWLLLIQSGEMSDADQAALQRWCGQSPSHRLAWMRAEAILDAFQRVPGPVGRGTLTRLDKLGRRQSLKLFSLLLLGGSGAWLAYRQVPWQQWNADLHTATGERRAFALADGTQLVLNTATSVDLAFSAMERRLTLLRGEILITTGQDPAPVPRPFIVQTRQGRLRALGTRFAVRHLDDAIGVAVHEGGVEIAPSGLAERVVVAAGEQRRFSATRIGMAEEANASDLLWEQGMLLAQDMRVGDLIKEFGRYRRGVLRCDPASAVLLVSGAFPLDDIEASLDLLEQSLPLRINRIGPWWVSITAR
ncbi:MAG TPA: FecR domain-containing protein [Hyphomicrobiales bacterium]|nr:FecR domain-containing protein [Hyphomicrobiales bacterium]